jgi:hypothetical protein
MFQSLTLHNLARYKRKQRKDVSEEMPKTPEGKNTNKLMAEAF